VYERRGCVTGDWRPVENFEKPEKAGSEAKNTEERFRPSSKKKEKGDRKSVEGRFEEEGELLSHRTEMLGKAIDL